MTTEKHPHTERQPYWRPMIVGKDNKLAVVTISFILWMTAVTGCWVHQSFHDGKLAELPSTVVHLTLALGATKVTHRIAEGNWEKVIMSIVDYFKKKKEDS